MTSAEKLDRMLKLEKPRDRTEIPVFPMIITWCGKVAGITQAEMIADHRKWLHAMDKCFEVIGEPDVTMALPPADTIFSMGLVSRIPGRELGDDELYQFIEKDWFTDENEYDRILQMGWDAYIGMHQCRVQTPPITNPAELYARFGTLGAHGGESAMHFLQRGIEPISHTSGAPVFDVLSLAHSMEPFLLDLVMMPEKIMDVVNAATPSVIEQTVGTLKQIHGTRVGIWAMRSSSTFISPAMFEEYAWPPLKQMIEAFWKAGAVSVLHCDANWLPMLKYFLELPKGSVHFELDGVTDIFKAYDIIGGWHSMRGDVPSTLFAFGTPEQVGTYCEKLITELGMKGGFMLGSGCEVPLNAKVENVKAMMDVLK
jgi:uroporphyrinogen decarboxylase